MNILTMLKLLALGAFALGAFFIYKLNRDNKELTFQNENLKTTLTARNQLIDRYREIDQANSEFKEKEYEKIDAIKKDSAIDPDILGNGFFNGLQRK